MTRTFIAIAAAAAVAGMATLAPRPAEARGGAVAAGIIGGFAAGALIAGAAAAAAPPPAVYYAPGPGPGCGWRRERYWDGYGWVVRRVRVCN